MRANTSALAAGRRHSVGRRRDGTVVAVGNDAAGECRVGRWEDVVAVAAGNVHTAANTGRSHTVGLRSDGTVLATGWNGDGQCDVAAWRDVTAVAAGWRRTIGLLANGTVTSPGTRCRPSAPVAPVTKTRMIFPSA
jgi:alpha-tubulin suppressor-like RCC1 family protein